VREATESPLSTNRLALSAQTSPFVDVRGLLLI
jgi:hypothetical protein